MVSTILQKHQSKKLNKYRGEKMKIEYEIYNPCGNVTALITTPISKECLHQSC